MDKIPLDEEKIRYFAQVQTNLCELEENANDDDIEKIINQIPEDMLTNRADLMVICELFALYARLHTLKFKRNTFKLLEKIMDHIKSILQDESSFFWNIFGGHLYFKYWLYEKGLISIDFILLCCECGQSTNTTEVFLPEILELRREIFDEEIKYNYKLPCTEDYVTSYRKKRDIHLKWLQNSCDYTDSIYDEIENNRLRLSIKRDDIDTFQRILSDSNLPIDTKISELTFESQFISPDEHTLLDYSICCNSMQIFKFLLLNDAKLSGFSVYHAISSCNYEIIHIIESQINEKFTENALKASLCLWNRELDEYVFNNYCDDHKFLTDEEIVLNESQYDEALIIFERIVSSSNFNFFESIILPFLKRNPIFVEKKIYELIFCCFSEMSCCFARYFLKYENIDLNHHVEENNYSALSKALEYENSNAIQMILSNKNIHINEAAFSHYPAFFIMCKRAIDLKTVDLICNYPNFNINKKDDVNNITAFDLAMSSGNFLVTEYILKKFPNVDINSLFSLIYYTLFNNHLYTLKIALKYYMKRNEDLKPEKIVHKFIKNFGDDDSFKPEFITKLKNIFVELGFKYTENHENEEEDESLDLDDINSLLDFITKKLNEIGEEEEEEEADDENENE